MDGLENVASVETQEVAAPGTQEETVNQTETQTEQNAEQESGAEGAEVAAAETKTEEDSRFANVRRKAEEEARLKYESQYRQINDDVKRLFGGYKNPETGKAIETMADYLEAYEAQQRLAQQEELRQKGIDPNMLNEIINNSPVVRQAQAAMEQQIKSESERKLAEDLKELGKIDPSIKSTEDLLNHPSYPQIYEYVSKHGLSLPDAYKLANYSTLNARQEAAVKQAAINQVKGKNHLETTGKGVADGDNLVDVPESTLREYRKFYPDLTDHELKVKYNSFLTIK